MAQGLLVLLFISTAAASSHVHNAVETEMFAIPISPNLFNWTYQEFDQQYRFHASLLGKPELPSWLRYIYSGRHHSGFIFGTPPRRTEQPITLEVIGLNRQDYETRRVLLTLKVRPKENLARHEVELKIDNLNVEDLLDEHRMTRLKEILKTRLWTESSQDLYTTFLASAIDLGARLPLRPSDGEGLVVRLGSSMPFSTQLKWLREEVRPLSRLPSCPREYKRTTSERLFRDAGFTLDWCNFELYNTIYKDRSTTHLEYLLESTPDSSNSHAIKTLYGAWSAPSSQNLPRRSYASQLTAAVAAPLLLLLVSAAALTAVLCFHYAAINSHAIKTLSGAWAAPSSLNLPRRSYASQLTAAVAARLLLLLVSAAALTAVLCFHYAAMRDSESEYFLENIFHICIDYRKRKRAHKSGKVEVCRYGTGDTGQTQVPDNASTKSLAASPSNSLVRPYSPRSTTNLAGSYNRPQPPPYVGTNSLHHRRSANIDKTPSTSSHTPEHRTHLALEESLKLLNDANISADIDRLLKDPIVDLADGAEDYVPVKSDGYVSMKTLDDIVVPDLSKFGISGPM